MNEEYINAAIKTILDLQQQGGFLNNTGNLGVSQQSLEQIVLTRLLDIRSLDIKGKYVVDSQGNEVPIVETVKGTILTKEGYPVNIEKERFHTMDDGTSLGEFAECMNHGGIVLKENLHRCPVCGKTCCVLCGKPSSSDQYYCSSWHRFIG